LLVTARSGFMKLICRTSYRLKIGANRTQAGRLCYTNSLECEAMSENHPPQAPRTQGNQATG
jgi:hypothetical protein